MPWLAIHRVCATAICVFCIPSLLSFAQVVPSVTASGPSVSTSAFFAKAQEALTSGKLLITLNLSATAEWVAGSDHESGTAQLQAKADGSTSVQLSLGKASRTDTQTSANSSRTCQWTDMAGTSHAVYGPNCFVAIPWFAPTLFTQPVVQLSSLLSATDEGQVTKDKTTLHQISYVLNDPQAYDRPSDSHGVNVSTVKVFYDPVTFLPASLEYQVHPDNNNLQNIDMKVVFSNYQPVSGVMLPFHIERYMNRSLQLTLDVTNATIE